MKKLAAFLLLGCFRLSFVLAQGIGSAPGEPAGGELRLLREQLALQQKQIEELRASLEEQKQLLERLLPSHPSSPVRVSAAFVTAGGVPVPGNVQATQQNQVVTTQELAKKTEELSRNLAGFKFSGDFRYRLDIQARSGNEIASPLQNIRSRYRLRMNVDKELDRRLGFHFQLSTGPFNNGITNDQEMAGLIAKHPFSISEAYVDFHPHPNFSMRGGRMEEIFADSMRFVWDDDVRFNGFHQVLKIPIHANFLGFKRVELRAGEYILSNPNVVILASGSPFLGAGFQPGQKVRDANLFHPGFLVQGDLGARWSHQVINDVQLYRNPNEIQLASTAAGFPVLVSNALGLVLAGPMTGTGNATTTPGGAIYSAPDFQIVRLAYRLERKGILLRGREAPAWLDFQASRNVGAGRLRDAVMASANLGAVRGFGDVRFLYQFAIKDANALISQFTDDDLGTGTGVNIAVHALRFDLGLTRFLQWQNLLFIQTGRRTTNPAEQFFVPFQRGANPTFRYQGHLAFSF